MRKHNDKKVIAYLMCVSIILLTLGIYTAVTQITFGNTLNGPINYDIHFSTPGISGKLDNQIIVNNNRIDMLLSLKKLGEESIINTSIVNDGDIDTKIKNINKTDLNTIVIGKSDKTGNIYTLNDYISFNIYYDEDNEYNNISKPNSVSVNDSLKRNTYNNLFIKIVLKDETRLTEDQVYVFNKIKKTNNVSLFLELEYEE